VARSELEQPARLVERLRSLHRDAGVESLPFQERLEIRRQEVAPQRAHRLVDPAVRRDRVAPEVLVRIDAHRDRGPRRQNSIPVDCSASARRNESTSSSEPRGRSIGSMSTAPARLFCNCSNTATNAPRVGAAAS
jgi:hypothetical protein